MANSWPACYDHVFAKFSGVMGGNRGRWEARCPAHDDDKASLSICLGESNKLLLKCHSPCQCTVKSIILAIGISMDDLYPDNKHYKNQFSATPRTTMTTQTPEQKPAQKIERKFEKSYDYRDEKGTLLFQVCRFTPKGFSQRSPNPAFDPKKPRDKTSNPEWLMNINGVRKVPYKLPEMMKAIQANPGRWIFIVEGEKDVDNLLSIGLVATCNPGGALKWDESYNAFFKKKNVMIVPDNDPIDSKLGFSPGIRHAQEVANHLVKVAGMVRILSLPNLPAKGDVTDWIEAQKKEGRDQSKIRELMGDLIKTAPNFGEGDEIQIGGRILKATAKAAAAAQPDTSPVPVTSGGHASDDDNVVAPVDDGSVTSAPVDQKPSDVAPVAKTEFPNSPTISGTAAMREPNKPSTVGGKDSLELMVEYIRSIGFGKNLVPKKVDPFTYCGGLHVGLSKLTQLIGGDGAKPDEIQDRIAVESIVMGLNCLMYAYSKRKQ